MSQNSLKKRIEQELLEIRNLVIRTQQFIQQTQLTGAALYQDALIGAIALNLHGFYTGAERIFEVIAKTIDGWEPTGADWHRQLLEQMCIDIPEVRQAVISEATRTQLDEFRRFRHVIRSIYAYQLEASRVLELAQKLNECTQHFEQEIQWFCSSLSSQ